MSVLAAWPGSRPGPERSSSRVLPAFQKMSLCLVYPPRRNTRIFCSLEKLCLLSPTLSLSLFLVMSEGQNALGWSGSVGTQASESRRLPEFQPCFTRAGGVEETQALRNTSNSFLKLTPYKDVYTFLFFIFFHFTISYLSPCRTATPGRYLRHLHSYSPCESRTSFYAWEDLKNYSCLFFSEERKQKTSSCTPFMVLSLSPSLSFCRSLSLLHTCVSHVHPVQAWYSALLD